MRGLSHDLRHTIRLLLKSPGFTLVAVLTLAIGIGVNTTVFSVINGMILRPLPVPRPEQIMVLASQQEGSQDFQAFSYPDYLDLRKQADVFSDVLAYRVSLVGLTVGGKGEHCVISRVTGNFFSTAGVQPAAGRLILPTEGQTPGADPVFVLGYSYWQRRFGGDKNIIGKQVELDGFPVTIIGVAPKEFTGLYAFINMDGYVPLSAVAGLGGNAPVEDTWTHRDERSLQLRARLKPGVSLPQVQASLQVIAKRLAELHPETDKGLRFSAFPEKLARPDPDPEGTLPKISIAFTILSALVLLVACFNIANILLVRATARQREMAIRTAIGAGWSRLARQSLTESLLLAVCGGSFGLLFGWWASGFLSSIPLGTDLPIQFNFHPDLRVYLFTSAVVLLTAIVVGVIPAIPLAKTDVNHVLREGSRGSSEGKQRNFMRNSLVVAQLAGSLLLLVVAGLFIRSLGKAEKLYLGFASDHLINVSLDVHEIGYDETRGKEFFRAADAKLRALPGIVSVAQAFTVPMGLIGAADPVTADRHPLEPGKVAPVVLENLVTPTYFDTLRIPIIRGRAFTESDNQSAPKVAIINETMAKKFWPSEDALGQRFKSRDRQHRLAEYEVVGIAQDSKYKEVIEDPLPFFYKPLAQEYMSLRNIQVRTSLPPEALEMQVASIVEELAPEAAISVKTMEQDLQGLNGYLFFRLGAQLTGALGVLGLILSIVGVYSVVSYAAAQRTHEIGIRMALGAGRSDVLRMVLSRSLLMIATGVAIGASVAFVGAKALASFLVGVSPSDPLTFFAMMALLLVVGLAACLVPAYRATRVDPLVALRYE